MKLSITDRLQIGATLPNKGDYVTLTLKADIQEKVKISQEEMKEIEFKVEGETYKWNREKAQDLDVEFTEAEMSLMQSKLRELDEKKELDEVTYRFYKKFIT